jgi:hypothetical protein
MSDSESSSATTPAEQGKRSLWARLTDSRGAFFVLSLLFHAVVIAVAAYLVVQVVQGREKLKFTAPPPTSDPSASAEHQVKMAKKKASMSPPTVSKRITTKAANASITLPPVEMNSAPADMIASMAGGLGATGLGAGATGGGGGGLPGLTAFGFRGGKGGLVGTFYDLKQTPDGKPTDMAQTPEEVAAGESSVVMHSDSLQQQRYIKALKGFTLSWNLEDLKPYYKASQQMNASRIFIPYMSAAEAPKAFGVEKNCKARRWIVHYKGRFVVPKKGTYRFVGWGDDILFVRINGQNVLDACMTDWGWNEGLHTENRVKDAVGPGPNPTNSKLCAGRWMELSTGQKVDMEAIIGEGPGGDFASYLMIEEKDALNPVGDYPVFQLKDEALPPGIRPGAGIEKGSVPANFSGKKMIFPGV